VEDEERRDCAERDPDKEGDAHPDAEGSAHSRSTLAPFSVERVCARRGELTATIASRFVKTERSAETEEILATLGRIEAELAELRLQHPSQR
jgi:hypothetical protein